MHPRLDRAGKARSHYVARDELSAIIMHKLTQKNGSLSVGKVW